MKKIVVIGSPGAGKSVFSERLGRVLGIEVTHLDTLYWRDGSPPPPDEWAGLERQVVEREQWVADGNYSATLAARVEAADTAIFLDLPRPVCLARFVARRLRPGGATGMPPERRAYVNWAAVRGILTFPRDHRAGFLDLLAEHEGSVRVVVLRKPREMRQFLDGLEQNPR